MSENKEFLTAILKQVSDSIIVTDKDFKIIYMNQAAEDLFGYTWNELKNKTPGILNAEPTGSVMQKQIYHSVTDGRIWTGKAINRRKDGTTFICEMKISPLLNETGTADAYIGIQRDVTNKTLSQEALDGAHHILKTTSELANKIISQGQLSVRQMLKTVGLDLDMNGVFVYYNEDGLKLYEAWCRGSKRYPTIEEPGNNLNGTKEWILKGHAICGKWNAIPEQLAFISHRHLLPTGSDVALIPIIIYNKPWGIIGYGRQDSGKWSIIEIEALSILGRIIASQITNVETERNLSKHIRESFEQVETMLNGVSS